MRIEAGDESTVPAWRRRKRRAVRDTGPGIGNSERDIVIRRFYRSDKSRQTQGLGLGLSLVAAIVKLHGFRFTIAPGSGCVAEIACPSQPALSS